MCMLKKKVNLFPIFLGLGWGLETSIFFGLAWREGGVHLSITGLPSPTLAVGGDSV